MNNLEKLNKVFVSTFIVEDSQVSELSYGNFNLWDSVGQMSLIANIEDAFDIMVHVTTQHPYRKLLVNKA